MKKSMLIAFVSLLGLTACGGNTPTSAEEESSTKGTSSTSEAIDYGELNIPLQTIREGYEKKISPVFSIPERAEELSYTVVDETVCVINDGVISGLKEGSTKVMAKSEHSKRRSMSLWKEILSSQPRSLPVSTTILPNWIPMPKKGEPSLPVILSLTPSSGRISILPIMENTMPIPWEFLRQRQMTGSGMPKS